MEALGANAPSRSWARSAQEMMVAVHGDAAVQDFLEQPQCRTLQVSVVHGGGGNELACSTAVGIARDAGADTSAVVFTKRGAEPLSADNMASAVMMSTLGTSPLQSLQLSMKQLYAPMLLQDPAWASQLDAKTRSTLEALDSALEAAMQLGSHPDTFPYNYRTTACVTAYTQRLETEMRPPPAP